jgi:hypothetical protein
MMTSIYFNFGLVYNFPYCRANYAFVGWDIWRATGNKNILRFRLETAIFEIINDSIANIIKKRQNDRMTGLILGKLDLVLIPVNIRELKICNVRSTKP